jgi:hypothetical protein
MNKALIGTVLSLGLAFSTVSAGEIKAETGIAVGSVKMGNKSGVEYDFVNTVQKVFDNGILIGIGTKIGVANMENVATDIYIMDADVKIGYEYHGLSIYGFGTILYNGSNSYDAYGYGGGTGLRYQPFNHLSINIDYTSVPSVEDVHGFTYDYSIARATISYVY